MRAASFSSGNSSSTGQTKQNGQCKYHQIYFALSELRAAYYHGRSGQDLDGSGDMARRPGYPAMDLLNTLLNLADAISAAVALAGFWYTWVLPADPRTLRLPRSVSAPDEMEQFLRAAALNKPSGQGIA